MLKHEQKELNILQLKGKGEVTKQKQQQQRINKELQQLIKTFETHIHGWSTSSASEELN